MSDRLFLDTNVLVYAYDTHEASKQGVAQRLLAEGIRQGTGYLSTQVLGEFFVAVTRRVKNPMTAEEASDIIGCLSILPVQEIEIGLVHRAIETHGRYGISYWDSLILAAAERAGCSRVYSEDLNDGQEYNGVLVVNPFR